MLFLLPAALAASPADIQSVWSRCQSDPNHQLTVALSAGDAETLAAGESVVQMVSDGDQKVAVGLRVVGVPAAQTWVAMTDMDHTSLSVTRATLRPLDGGTPTRGLRYGLIDVPAPLSDRQWAWAVHSNGPLWEGTERQCWEKTYELLPPEAMPTRDPDAVWFERYDGGWALAELGGETLVVVIVGVDIGGSIPEGLMLRLSRMAMSDNLEVMEGDAIKQPTHYLSGHSPLYSPTGEVMPPLGG